jgi:hypothetical protein
MVPEIEVASATQNPALPILGKARAKAQVYAKIRAVDGLTSLEIERMYQLMQLYYDNVELAQFKTDLLEKDHVILLHDKNTKTIQGFSTLLKVPLVVNKKKIIGVYSGDTVLSKSYWGTSALGIAFLQYLWQLKVMNLDKPIYWFLISKGYKTYLLMANNFITHFPRFEMETPEYYKNIMSSFYGKKFSGSYSAPDDLIRFNKPSCHLRENVAAIKQDHLRLPRVKFFQKKNPHWQRGDELTCIAEMTLFMPLTYAIKKLIKGFFR